MPDFERVLRPLQLDLATPEQRPVVEAEFKGEDRARWQIAKVFGALAALALFFAWIFGR